MQRTTVIVSKSSIKQIKKEKSFGQFQKKFSFSGILQHLEKI